MKFKVGDSVTITAGKDKGKKGEIAKVLPSKERVVVTGVNLYTRHFKPQQGQAGQKVRKERPLPTANVAILNDQDKADRIGYRIMPDGKKERFYKKTGKTISEKK